MPTRAHPRLCRVGARDIRKVRTLESREQTLMAAPRLRLALGAHSIKPTQRWLRRVLAEVPKAQDVEASQSYGNPEKLGVAP